MTDDIINQAAIRDMQKCGITELQIMKDVHDTLMKTMYGADYGDHLMNAANGIAGLKLVPKD